MFNLTHQMRARMIKSLTSTTGKLMGVILLERTIRSQIGSMNTADYLWEKLNIVPSLKADKRLQGLQNGVQLMKPFLGLDDLLKDAVRYHVFDTEMCNVIKEANGKGTRAIVDQQFKWGK